jgi:hypothetical protein
MSDTTPNPATMQSDRVDIGRDHSTILTDDVMFARLNQDD